MSRLVRSLAFASVVVTVPLALGATPAGASTAPGATPEGIVTRTVLQFVKKNWIPLYMVLDEILDDLCGCGGGTTPPPPPPDPEPDPLPYV